MELLKDFTYLQLFWGVQTLYIGLSTLYIILSGSFWDKTQGDRDPTGQLGWFQFRKRITLYHFISSLWTLWILWNCLSSYCFGWTLGARFDHLLEWVASPRNITTDSTCTLIGLALFLTHVFHRFYIGWTVSIFSRRQTLNPITLAIYFSYFLAAPLTVVAESADFSNPIECFSWNHLSWYHILAVAIFYKASTVHGNAHRTLARLRKNRAGHVVTTGYKVPKGEWFDSVSCPHYLAEILIYVSIGLCLGLRSTTWWWLVTYVIANQFYLAYSTHQWYLKKFDDYPKSRKMLIPFLV